MSAAPLGYGELALASALLWLNGALSLWLGLGLERRMLVAGVRMVVQLLLVGLILKALFAMSSALITGLAVLIMIGVAAHEVHARQERRLSGAWGFGIGAVPMMAATIVVTVLALVVEVGADPWHDPRYTIPLAGIILGSVMNGVSLGLSGLIGGVARERAGIEAQLALGVPRLAALRPLLRQALRNAWIPLINQMSAAGIITLPGMMTGQILAGMDPVDAVKYQILIMFLLAGGTGFGVLGAVYGAAWRLTDERHRLRLDRVATHG
jgi:putative ABC transport system permease protein